MAVSERLPSPSAGPRTRARADAPDSAAPALWPWWMWPLMLAAVIAASIWFVHWSGMRPSFDPFGWLTWGHQLLYGGLDLNAAPSWKPLTIIFTLPFSLFGGTSVSMWSVTSTAGTLLMGVFAARIVYRLTDDVRARPDAGRWVIAAAWIGALFAGVGVLGMAGLPKLTYIANSDQLNTALVLAALDAHLSRRPRLAYVVLFLAALGRPEVWALSGLLRAMAGLEGARGADPRRRRLGADPRRLVRARLRLGQLDQRGLQARSQQGDRLHGDRRGLRRAAVAAQPLRVADDRRGGHRRGCGDRLARAAGC